MSSAMLVGLESLFLLVVFYAFCWHQLRFLKRDRAEREAKKRAAVETVQN